MRPPFRRTPCYGRRVHDRHDHHDRSIARGPGLPRAVHAARARASARLGDDEERLVYAPDGTVTGVRHAWTFDDMFSAFATQGLEQQAEGRVHPRGTAAARQGQCRVAQGIRLLHVRQGRTARRSTFVDPADYYLDFDSKDAVLTLHFTLPFKTPVKAQDARSRSTIPTYFVDFELRREGSGRAGRRARRLHSSTVAAAGDEHGDGAAARRDAAGPSRSRRTARRAVRQQDLGEMSRDEVAGGAR